MAEFELRRISEGELRQVLKVAPLHWALYTEAALYKNIGDINVPEWRRVSDEISVQPIWGGEIVLRDKSCGYDSEDSVSECLFEEGEHDVVLRHSVGRQDKNHGFFWGTDPLVWLKEVQISLKAPVGSPSLQEQCLRTYQDISWREIPNEFCERLSVSPEGYNERYKVFSAKETAE